MCFGDEQKSDLYKHTSFSLLQRTFITLEEGAFSSFYAAASPEVEEKKIWCVTGLSLILPQDQS